MLKVCVFLDSYFLICQNERLILFFHHNMIIFFLLGNDGYPKSYNCNSDSSERIHNEKVNFSQGNRKIASFSYVCSPCTF